MLNDSIKKTVLAPSIVKATPGPLPGTEPGAGTLRIKLDWKVVSRVFKLAIVLAVLAGIFQAVLAQSTVTINDKAFNVRVADEYYEQTTGLSTTESLQPNEGMLFVHQEEDFYPIWMKDMNFAIDIVWIDANKQVISIDHNVEPESYPAAFISEKPAMYILEIPAGAAAAAGIQAGQTAKFDLRL